MTVEPRLANPQATTGSIQWLTLRETDVSETFRDLRPRMEKQGLISRLSTWITLRDLRNRALHDYLPDEPAALYAAIVGEAVPAFRRLDAAAGEPLRSAEESGRR